MFRPHRSELEKRIKQLEKDTRTRREFMSEHADVILTIDRLQMILALTKELDARAFGAFEKKDELYKNVAILRATAKVMLRQVRQHWATFWED